MAKLVTATFDWDSGYRVVVRAEYVIDPGTGMITGPSEYMNSEDYTRRMAEITGGRDMLTNFGYSQHGDVIKAALVSLQTDYAAWAGMREFDRRLSA